MLCLETKLKTLRQEVLMNSPSFYSCVSDQVLKILKTEVLMNVSSFWRLEDSEDQVPKTLKTEVLMNVSSLYELEALKISARRKLLLIKLRWSSNWSEVNGESTRDLQIVHRTVQFVQGSHFHPCKKHCTPWVANKFHSLSLSQRTHFLPWL